MLRERRWKRKLVSRFSFVLAVILLPKSHKRVAAEEFMGPRVSNAIGSKMCVLAKPEHLATLRAAASFAAEPAVCDVDAMYEVADEQMTVTSQVSGFPWAHPAYGTKVRPSGLFPSSSIITIIIIIMGDNQG